jgi:hypothetical protein
VTDAQDNLLYIDATGLKSDYGNPHGQSRSIAHAAQFGKKHILRTPEIGALGLEVHAPASYVKSAIKQNTRLVWRVFPEKLPWVGPLLHQALKPGLARVPLQNQQQGLGLLEPLDKVARAGLAQGFILTLLVVYSHCYHPPGPDEGLGPG